MVNICEPDDKEITLNKCWKFIKKAVYDAEKAKNKNITLANK